jgi:Flp pilus assembly pilin Flp
MKKLYGALCNLHAKFLTKEFFTKREEGAAMAEYALLLALITVGLVVVVNALGTAISGAFTNATNSI